MATAFEEQVMAQAAALEAEHAAVEHKITWFVWAGSEKIRRTSSMRGQWGYDVECSCGQATRTGGATKRHITERVYDHTHYGLDL